MFFFYLLIILIWRFKMDERLQSLLMVCLLKPKILSLLRIWLGHFKLIGGYLLMPNLK
jgi:hypothetical protein